MDKTQKILAPKLPNTATNYTALTAKKIMSTRKIVSVAVALSHANPFHVLKEQNVQSPLLVLVMALNTEEFVIPVSNLIYSLKGLRSP